MDSIKRGIPIYPLILLGKNLFLVDGYARYRALKELDIKKVKVIRQI
jgi:ParB-like chromosome segregation protein Spo0J